MSDLEGTFPFGTPAGRCAPRAVRHASAFVLGVYPSALHIRWKNPQYGVAALAVAPEPWPFWPGTDEAALVARWRDQVGWRASWGEALPVGRLNGSSGRWVHERVLAPLGIPAGKTWSTDALPFFFVHQGQGKQGAAMKERYDRFAEAHGLQRHRLPARPSTAALVGRSVREEGPRLLDEIAMSGAPLVVTLGNESLAVASRLLDGELPTRLTADAGYGRHWPVLAGGRSVDVLPLVHPGQREEKWRAVHERWMAARVGPNA